MPAGERAMIFDHAPQAYLVTDTHGTIRRANHAARRLLQRPALPGLALATMLPVETRRRLRRFIGRLRPGVPVDGFFELRTPKGEIVPCRMSANLAPDESSGEHTILWLLADITELRRFEDQARSDIARLETRLSKCQDELETAIEELQDATTHKDQFLAMMSHELRTPLTVLVGGARILHARLENVPSDDRRELLADMLRHGLRLQQLIENLIVLARGRSVELEKVSLRRLLPNIVFSYQLADPGLLVRLHVPEDLPPARGSTLAIEQVVRNVLSNARQHGRSSEPVEITARRLGHYVAVSLRDRGPGISQAELKRIFEPYQHSQNTPRQATATGIGLTVARRLMEAQHGGIWAHRPGDGPGAVFTFALPLAEDKTTSVIRTSTSAER